MPREYVFAIVHTEAGNYGIHYPDYPGCISGGSTLAEVVYRGAVGLNFHVQGMVEDGEAIPEPRTPEEWLATEEVKEDLANGGIAMLVEVDLPRDSRWVELSIENRLLRQVDKAASLAGQSRATFLADAARARLSDAD